MLKFVILFGIIAAVSCGGPSGPGPAHAYAIPGGSAYFSSGYAGYAAPAYTYNAIPAGAAVVRTAPATVISAAASPIYADTIPNYNYGYSVSDPISGDAKQQTESRNGDLTSGQYSLVEPNGNVRTVTYTSTPHTGFQATVHNSLPAAVTRAAVVAAPYTYTAPVAAYVAGRSAVAYTAPGVSVKYHI